MFSADLSSDRACVGIGFARAAAKSALNVELSQADGRLTGFLIHLNGDGKYESGKSTTLYVFGRLYFSLVTVLYSVITKLTFKPTFCIDVAICCAALTMSWSLLGATNWTVRTVPLAIAQFPPLFFVRPACCSRLTAAVVL